MAKPSSTTGKTQGMIEVIVACTLAVLAVVCFATQMCTYTPQTSTRETALFNLLQFVLTVGFTWFGSRAISRKQYEANIKAFALGAYRRVCDIERMLERLQTTISEMTSMSTAGDIQNLRVVSAVVDDTKLIINSSVSDWADVIGEELTALSEINRLETERLWVRDVQERPPSATASTDASRLQKQIEELRATLPAILRSMPRSRNASPYAAEWLATKHLEEDGLRLRVVTGEGYSSDDVPDPANWPQPLLLAPAEDGSGQDLRGDDGKVYGRLMNFLPLDYDETMRHLRSCYGRSDIEVEVTRVIRTYEVRGREFSHVEVRVLCPPRVRSQSWLLEEEGKKKG